MILHQNVYQFFHCFPHPELLPVFGIVMVLRVIRHLPWPLHQINGINSFVRVLYIEYSAENRPDSNASSCFAFLTSPKVQNISHTKPKIWPTIKAEPSIAKRPPP